MKTWAAIGVLLVLGFQYGEVVRADSDSSDSSSSGERKQKNKNSDHKYNNPAYPQGGYNPYYYNQLNPSYPPPPMPGFGPYPPPPMPGYPPYPYNPYMQAPPPQQSNPSMYLPDPAASRAGYPASPGGGQNPGWNPNSPPNQQQPPQPTAGPGPQPSAQYPPGGSSVINHSLKVNKEYNEDGHHTSSK
ncbi:circumsporozoite protein [Drosophila ficusphila]|uniref:circumsporozoite protein n=1 Tax=Drosophila ficusphila TaxID=30025 RepID=UPI001C8A3F35|nr:circumsporozoite protein [Drosophila ficusphila]